MAKVAIIIGLILMALGIGSYIGTAGASLTALIPCAIGLPILVCGALALNALRRKAAMHVAVVIALLGFLGSLGRAIQLPAALSHAASVAHPIAVYASTVLNVLCLIFIILAVRSFIDARRAV